MRRVLSTGVVSLVASLFPVAMAFGQQATLLQQFYVMKAFAPNVDKVGVLVSQTPAAEFKDKLGRASAAVGVQAVISVVAGLNDLSRAYQELVTNYRVRFIWIPPEDAVLCSDVARDYLVRKAVTEGVGILAPSKQWVAQGATLYVGLDGEKVKPYYNSRALQALGLTVPDKFADVSTATSE
jgi:ABC-type uncharacterized transport system substrate-binding protein